MSTDKTLHFVVDRQGNGATCSQNAPSPTEAEVWHMCDLWIRGLGRQSIRIYIASGDEFEGPTVDDEEELGERCKCGGRIELVAVGMSQGRVCEDCGGVPQ